MLQAFSCQYFLSLSLSHYFASLGMMTLLWGPELFTLILLNPGSYRCFMMEKDVGGGGHMKSCTLKEGRPSLNVESISAPLDTSVTDLLTCNEWF